MSATDTIRMLLRRDATGRAARAKVRDFGRCLAVAARHGLPSAYAYFGEAPGDDLLATIALRAMAERGMPKPWYGTNFPGLFVGNPDIARVVPFSPQFAYLLRRLGRRVFHFEYQVPSDTDRTTPPPREHLAAMMCRQSGIVGDIALAPRFTLEEHERSAGRQLRRQIAIMSIGISGRFVMANKQWNPKRYQAVVDQLHDRFDFVQVGVRGDVALNGTLNLCGQTSVRETAAILAESLCFVGNVGFLMHLARAVGTRSVIVYGGREAPWQSGYACNENLYRAVPCAPCWLSNRCDFDRRCLREVTVDDVVEAIGRQVARHGEPLPDERVDLDTTLAFATLPAPIAPEPTPC